MHSYLRGHPALIHAIERLERVNPDQFEVYFEHRKKTRITNSSQHLDNRIHSPVSSHIFSEDVGISIRILKDRRLGFSYTTSLNHSEIHRAVDDALLNSSLTPEDEYSTLHAFGSSVYPSVDNFDANAEKLPLTQKLQNVKALTQLCRESDSRVHSPFAALTETLLETHLVDSSGEHIHHKSSGYTAQVSCQATAQGDTQFGKAFSFSNYLDTLELPALAKTAAERATEGLRAEVAPMLKCPAVLRNSVVAELLEFLIPSFSAEEMHKGFSVLKQSQGQLIFSEVVTLVNDGLLPGGAGTTPFDAEGIPSKQTVLVDGGFFTGTLYNTYHAKKNNVEPSGCTSRGIRTPPSIGFSNFYMKPGRKPVDALMDGIRTGVLVTRLVKIDAANPVTGDFSVVASGILIKNGKLSHGLKGFTLTGNVLELFQRMTDISNDLKFFRKIGAPSVRLSEVSVTG